MRGSLGIVWFKTEPTAQFFGLYQRLPTLQTHLFLSVVLACSSIYLGGGCPSSLQDYVVWNHITPLSETCIFFHFRR